MIRTFVPAAVLLIAASAFAQTETAQAPLNESAKRQEIRSLIVSMHIEKQMDALVDQVFASIAKVSPKVPPEAWARMRQGLNFGQFVDMTVDIYDQNFTEAEIHDLDAFYKTPTGQKLIEKMPIIMQESMQRGQKLGQELAQKVMARMKQEGYI